MDHQGKPLTAELKADGKLHWSDGHIWYRSQLATGTLFHKLYARDGSHPSKEGTYLAALVIFAKITGITFQGTQAGFKLSISSDEARYLRQVASRVALHVNSAQSCSQARTDSGEHQACTDSNEHCASWAKDGWCTRSQNYMHRHCKLSCSVCKGAEDEESTGRGRAAQG